MKTSAAKRAYNILYREKNREYLNLYDRNRKRPVDYLPKHKAYRKKWIARNKLRIAKVNREWYLMLKSDSKKYARHRKLSNEWRRSNPEARRGLERRYIEKNRGKYNDKCRVARRRRKSRLRGAGGNCTVAEWRERVRLYRSRCAYCSVKVSGSNLHMDHVIPVSKGGSNWPKNLVPACSKCNIKKGADSWKPKRPML